VSRRLAWLLFAVAVVGAPLGLALGLIGEHHGLDLPPGRESELYIELIAAAAAWLFAGVGLLIARKEGSNAIGWLFLSSAPMLAAISLAYGYADLALYGGQGWPGSTWAAWLASWLVIVPVFVVPCLIAQLFPNGRPLSGPWRHVLRLSVVVGLYLGLAPALDAGPLGSYPTIENPAALPRGVARFLVDATWGISILVLFVLSLAAVSVRFRRSRGVEREQLKWLALAGGVTIVGFLGGLFLIDLVGWLSTALIVVGFGGFLSMPVAVAIAILRYRLYEIDRLVSRTLVYGALTVVLGAAYLGLVLAGQALFSSFAGGSNLAIAVSTLVVAALFLPVRSRVQRLVDRRFYRRRYDAQRTLEAFGTRLREQVDLETLDVELRRAVDETMKPTHVSIWLRAGVET
jgi:hypothetical protein